MSFLQAVGVRVPGRPCPAHCSGACALCPQHLAAVTTGSASSTWLRASWLSRETARPEDRGREAHHHRPPRCLGGLALSEPRQLPLQSSPPPTQQECCCESFPETAEPGARLPQGRRTRRPAGHRPPAAFARPAAFPRAWWAGRGGLGHAVPLVQGEMLRVDHTRETHMIHATRVTQQVCTRDILKHNSVTEESCVELE